jgi:hypothetical protein
VDDETYIFFNLAAIDKAVTDGISDYYSILVEELKKYTEKIIPEIGLGLATNPFELAPGQTKEIPQNVLTPVVSTKNDHSIFNQISRPIEKRKSKVGPFVIHLLILLLLLNIVGIVLLWRIYAMMQTLEHQFGAQVNIFRKPEL